MREEFETWWMDSPYKKGEFIFTMPGYGEPVERRPIPLSLAAFALDVPPEMLTAMEAGRLDPERVAIRAVQFYGPIREYDENVE